MSVFIDIPPYIGIKIIKQRFYRGKDVALFEVPIKPMVPLTRFIVVSEKTRCSINQRQNVFERMQAAGQNSRQPPNHDLGEYAQTVDFPPPDQELRQHGA
jgi:hypothetical protein